MVNTLLDKKQNFNVFTKRNTETLEDENSNSTLLHLKKYGWVEKISNTSKSIIHIIFDVDVD